MSGIRLLVTGGRDYHNKDELYNALDRIASKHYIEVLIHGAARGADTLAGRWAQERGIEVIAVPANWTQYGRQAGPIRNLDMLNNHCPNLVVAFSGGKGTKNMIDISKKAGIKVVKI